MFGDEYKKSIDEIKADPETKEKVLDGISAATAVKKPIKKARIFKMATAMASSFAIVLSLWAVVGNSKNGDIGYVDQNSSTTVESQSIPEATEETVYEVESIQSQNDKKPNTPKKPNYKKIYKAVKNTVDNYDLLIDCEDFVGETVAMGGNSATVNKGSGLAEKPTTDSSVNATKPTTTPNSNNAQSETVNQVQGVEEADIVKTDGKYIYCLRPNKGYLKIVKAGDNPKLIGTFSVAENNLSFKEDMYLAGDRLVIIGVDYNDTKKTKALILDVGDPEKPKKLYTCEQSGRYEDSRLIGDKLYLITDYNIYGNDVVSTKPETYVPLVDCKNFEGAVLPESIYINDNCTKLNYTVISGFSVKDGTLKGTQSFFGGTYTLYCSQNNIITAGYGKGDTTPIVRCSINDGEIKFEAEGEIKGTLLNQFSIDEHNGFFRFVTTESGMVESSYKDENGRSVTSVKYQTSNSLYILKSDLKQKSAIKNLAPDERIYSVRFMGNTAYFVTFRETDPLFSVDLSDPAKPKVLGALKIPGFSNYLFPFGKDKLLGVGKGDKGDSTSTRYVKLSMFDVSDPSNVTETSKEVLDDRFSSALETHKATYINSEKKIIGLGVYDETKGCRYLIYKYEKGKFNMEAEINVNDNGNGYPTTRGLYINNDLYIYAVNKIFVCSLKDFTVKNVIKMD